MSFRSFLSAPFLFALLAAADAGAVPLLPVSQETSVGAFVELDGGAVDLRDGFIGGTDAKVVFDSTALHAQSAGRSRFDAPPTIAANASFESFNFRGMDVFGQGQASQELTFAAGAGPLRMHFVLPELLLEISDTVERLGAGGVPFIGGDIRATLAASICVSAPGLVRTCVFTVQARLEGDYGQQDLFVTAMSLDPALDLGAFDAQSADVQDDGIGFRRTATWEFPVFEGELDLGAFAPGTLTIAYEMLARVEGVAALTSAAAAINDPFFLETDPTGGAPLLLDGVAAAPAALPEPSSLALLVPLALLALRRRR
jgi:hypothetical protein